MQWHIHLQQDLRVITAGGQLAQSIYGRKFHRSQCSQETETHPASVGFMYRTGNARSRASTIAYWSEGVCGCGLQWRGSFTCHCQPKMGCRKQGVASGDLSVLVIDIQLCVMSINLVRQSCGTPLESRLQLQELAYMLISNCFTPRLLAQHLLATSSGK